MASGTESDGVTNGVQPITAVNNFGVSAEEFATAGALLAKGVLVTFRPYTKGGSRPRDGNLQFDGGNTLLFVPVNKKKSPLKQGRRETMVASIDEVRLETAGEENVCRVLLKEGAAGPSFSFQCAADAGGFSRFYLTKFVAAVLSQSWGPAQKKGDLLGKARRMTTFAELLEPMGLVDKYESEFRQCGILFENLGVVTREDLAEVVGITNRVDQINIMGQIRRCFLDPPPERRMCGCSCDNGDSEGKSFSSGVGALAKMFGAIADL